MREVIQIRDTLKVVVFHFLTRSYATRTNVLSDSSDTKYQQTPNSTLVTYHTNTYHTNSLVFVDFIISADPL